MPFTLSRFLNKLLFKVTGYSGCTLHSIHLLIYSLAGQTK